MRRCLLNSKATIAHGSQNRWQPFDLFEADVERRYWFFCEADCTSHGLLPLLCVAKAALHSTQTRIVLLRLAAEVGELSFDRRLLML